jgi:YidC/Oxa1 family membrane protein insertase
VTFNFLSLDYIYYPISGIMWIWHKIFGAVLGPDNVLSWVLSVVFLIFTLRAILFKPFMKQMESQLKMQAIQPEMKRIRAKYKDDKQRLSEEMMKLNKEAGVNPLASCLPALIQAPVFIGLFHVLRMFQPVENPPGVWNLKGQVYFFGPEDVQSFANAKLPGGAPLIGFMTMPQGQLAFLNGVREAIIWWGVPLMIMAGIATHLTSRRSVARQAEMNIDASANPQTAIMNKLMLYMFPLFVVVGGPFFPLAILFYWLANNSWTFGQLRVAHTLQDRKRLAAAQVVEEVKDLSKFSTPKPGAKPKAGRPVIEPSKIVDSSATGTPPGSGGGNGRGSGGGSSNGGGGTAAKGGRTTAGSKTTGSNPAASNPAASKPAAAKPVGSKPAPGAKPQRSPGQQKKKNSGQR